ncbi:hypothetical protein BV349_05540 [Pseudomonas syringae pv. actinidiae]|uniref:Phosphoribosylaminoimidazole-succinocarboxamide synthase n=1 Tax=Pseudomonas syringae pv. actinidiae TaxID=103796 RepID=A0A2V0Q4V8_PSESF|nr:hypothetical protein BV349_05540 [Pseudomonas syringae pv. actinidiae]OSN65152.1 hypothetical protein BV351_05578 [Pseudomonas syringae pv. actinidiae]RMS09002.1 hypothetical protein ALP75_204310 [Pseudomonas syringae pv. actinidiae]BBI44515.1 hypothetical protein KPSA1B_103253 [Pseudomonas syringae pv. actinidiae]GBH07421.1 Phosphoribosylaminoimidazole-succinocarboxamide synthase [Pseudomonas syringae pv. actinidiae]
MNPMLIRSVMGVLEQFPSILLADFIWPDRALAWGLTTYCAMQPERYLRLLSRAENMYIPASTASKNMRTCQCPVSRMVTAGPGQIPAIPQPIPNARLPPIKRASNSFFTGKCIRAPSKDCLFLRAQLSGMAATEMAPAITRASDGSHVPLTSRKARTLAGFAIPAKSRPKPNIKPEKNAVNLIIVRLPVHED